jgi:hypothetical protein
MPIIRFQKYTTKAKTVPMLINSKKRWLDVPENKFCTMTRCPELLTGINSVSPWIRPRTIVSIVFTASLYSPGLI